MKLLNLTPHTIHLGDLAVPPSGTVARVAAAEVAAGEVALDDQVVPLIRRELGQVEDLPPPADGVLLIVSAMVLEAARDRQDLCAPGRLVRDAQGRVTGCEALIVR